MVNQTSCRYAGLLNRLRLRADAACARQRHRTFFLMVTASESWKASCALSYLVANRRSMWGLPASGTLRTKALKMHEQI